MHCLILPATCLENYFFFTLENTKSFKKAMISLSSFVLPKSVREGRLFIKKFWKCAISTIVVALVLLHGNYYIESVTLNKRNHLVSFCWCCWYLFWINFCVNKNRKLQAVWFEWGAHDSDRIGIHASLCWHDYFLASFSEQRIFIIAAALVVENGSRPIPWWSVSPYSYFSYS